MSNEFRESQFIDINKGFRRVGNFPLVEDEVFSTYQEASDYALTGANGGSSYVGQIIRVMPDNALDDPAIYLVNSEYRLASTADHIATNDNLSISFSYESTSGSEAISLLLPQGFILNNISVKITEGFKNDNAIRIGLCPYNNPSGLEYLILSGPATNFAEEPKFLMLTDEDDSEYTFNTTKMIDTRTLLVVFIDRASDVTRKGKGILKIN